MIALSIRRPWPWAILHLPPELAKDVENRNWPTTYRGKFLIHAGKGCARDEYENASYFIRGTVYEIVDGAGASRDEKLVQFAARLEVPPLADMPSGAIVGWCEILDCVDHSDSPWFCGRYGFVLGRRGVLEPIPCRGQLGFFKVPAEVAQAVREQAAQR